MLEDSVLDRTYAARGPDRALLTTLRDGADQRPGSRSR
jgi:hypothetical protein